MAEGMGLRSNLLGPNNLLLLTLVSHPSFIDDVPICGGRGSFGHQRTTIAISSSRAVPITFRHQEAPDAGITAETRCAGRGLAGGCLLTA